jgi:hypothetical protein
MSRYTLTRDAINTTLQGVDGIGVVFKHPRYSADWASFLELFKQPKFGDPTKSVINVAMVTRTSVSERPQLAENIVTINTLIDETWSIMLFYSFDDDSEQPSEFEFQELCDRVMDAFRPEEATGFTASVHTSEPLFMSSAGLYTLGEVLVHRADFILRLVQYNIT